MSLAMACVMPLMVASLGYLMRLVRSRAVQSQKVYAKAGAVAEEALGSIRTVASLTAEQRCIDKYNEFAREADADNLKLAKVSSPVFGLYLATTWLMYAIGLWYGGHKVATNKAEPQRVFAAFFGILLGTISLAQISPNITAVAQAQGAAAALFEILDTPSVIDASASIGISPATCHGRIELVNLHFAYPSRPDAPVLNGLNVTVEAGQTVAFVGTSGGGKSTLVALLERFYDPSQGALMLDGRDVKTLNVQWLRGQIGLVSQEPVLFATTIFDNIAAGIIAAGGSVTREQVEAAARLANAHDFIMALPQQYETLVGDKGVSLSGGQKQRVAIARAIVRDPKVLVLDEATSALDNESERVVQAALNDLMEKTHMTTIVIAHRLSTVRDADKIVVLSGGVVVEEGRHEALLQMKDGVYQGMYTAQERKERQDAELNDLVRTVSPEDRNRPSIIQTKDHVQGSTPGLTTMKQVPATTGGTPNFTLTDAMELSRPERKQFVVGMIASAFNGFALPCSSILISELIALMYHLFKDSRNWDYLDEISHDVTIYGSCYIGGAVAIFAFKTVQTFTFRYMAEKLTSRLRDIHFSALCRQDVAFFDEKKNATGALTANLSTNATKVALISGDSQGRVVQALFTFVAAFVISFSTGSWLLSLIMLAVFPFLIVGHVIKSQQMRGKPMSDELADAGAHASEALNSIRTVASLGLETHVTDKFSVLLKEPIKAGRREAQVNGLAIGFSSFIMLATYALVFWYGGVLVDKNDITFKQLMRTLMAIMMSAQGVGAASAWLGEAENATKAGAAIMTLRNREPTIDSSDNGGKKPAIVDGKIEFQNVEFHYPTRPEARVLQDFNLTVMPGETVALCGPSGGGKSTCISLLERFYDPVEGKVLLDGNNLKDLNVNWLRSRIGLVGQEPTLFIGTIAENIAYGLDYKPSRATIEDAARMANAHDFIANFPDGYDTQVGKQGEQLSGGQKQRIAIARVILKKPQILLLDEATSALDTESERVVQAALDNAESLKSCTTIIIAHRITTIRNADNICVVANGRIAEQGTHEDLLRRKGLYARLVSTNLSA